MIFLKRMLGRGVQVGLKRWRPDARESLTSATHTIAERNSRYGFRLAETAAAIHAASVLPCCRFIAIPAAAVLHTVQQHAARTIM